MCLVSRLLKRLKLSELLASTAAQHWAARFEILLAVKATRRERRLLIDPRRGFSSALGQPPLAGPKAERDLSQIVSQHKWSAIYT